jgi:hypothetical protein
MMIAKAQNNNNDDNPFPVAAKTSKVVSEERHLYSPHRLYLLYLMKACIITLLTDLYYKLR